MEPRKRASLPKVRTGCQTCKARHKKCDEAHPFCLMCTKTGQKCEYKITPDRRKRASPTARQSANREIISPRLVDASQADLTPTERRYLELFRLRTSAQCAGSTVDEFWQRLIHQVSETEPAVRYATIAISAMHWQFLYDQKVVATPVLISRSHSSSFSSRSRSLSSSSSEPELDDDILFPLQQCNKALASLRQNLTRVHAHVTSSAHREAVLVTCAALVSFSLFQGDAKAAIKHMESGHDMLLEWQKVGFDGNPSGPILIRAFQDFQLHQITFGQKAEVDEVHVPVWQNYTNSSQIYGYSEARGTTSELLTILGSVVSANFPHRLRTSESPRLRALFENAAGLLCEPSRDVPTTVVGRLHAWKSQLQLFMLTNTGMFSPSELAPLLLIELWTEFVYLIVVYAYSNQDEMVYDSYTPNFQRMNELAKLFLETESQSETFCVKVTFMPPIYFCGQKCRDWYTRREALRVISSSRRREGFWGSEAVGAVLAQFVDEESAGLGPDDLIPLSARIDLMHVISTPHGLNDAVWYHRPSAPGEIEAGADPSGIWKKIGVAT